MFVVFGLLLVVIFDIKDFVNGDVSIGFYVDDKYRIRKFIRIEFCLLMYIS